MRSRARTSSDVAGVVETHPPSFLVRAVDHVLPPSVREAASEAAGVEAGHAVALVRVYEYDQAQGSKVPTIGSQRDRIRDLRLWVRRSHRGMMKRKDPQGSGRRRLCDVCMVAHPEKG
jgi:hypothetical protein